MILLNIGEQINGGERKLTFPRVYAALRLADAAPVIATYGKAEEWTFIIQLEKRLSEIQLHDVATVLEQEAIAQYDTETQRGELGGPKASAWGPFDPARFLTIGGVFAG